MRVAVALVLVAAVVAGTLNLVAPALFGDLNGLVLVEDDAVAPDYVEGQVVLVRTDTEYEPGDIVVFPFGDETAIGRVEEGGPRSGYAIRADEEPLPYPVRPTADAITGRVVIGLPKSLSLVVAIVAAVPTSLLIVALVPLLVLWSPSQLRRRQEVARARDAFGTSAWEDAMAALRAYTAARGLETDDVAEVLPDLWPEADDVHADDEDGLWARTDAWWRRRSKRVVVDGIPVPADEYLRARTAGDELDESDEQPDGADTVSIVEADRVVEAAEVDETVDLRAAEEQTDDVTTAVEVVEDLPVEGDDGTEPQVGTVEDLGDEDVEEVAEGRGHDVTERRVAAAEDVGIDAVEDDLAPEDVVEPVPADESAVATSASIEVEDSTVVRETPVVEEVVEDRADDLAVVARASAPDARVDVPVAQGSVLDPVGVATSGPVVPSDEPPRLLSGALTVLMLLLSAVAGFYALGRLGSDGETITTVSGLEVGVGPAVTAAALTSLGLLTLAGVVFWYGFLRTPWDRYATLYWWLIAEIPSVATLDGPHRELETIQQLITVAQKERRTVLHQRRPDGTHRWLVQTPDVVLSHTLVPPRPEDEQSSVPDDVGVLIGRDERSGLLVRHVVDLDEFVDAYAGHDDVDVVEEVLDDGTSRLSVVLGDLVLVHDVVEGEREERAVVHSAASDEQS